MHEGQFKIIQQAIANRPGWDHTERAYAMAVAGHLYTQQGPDKAPLPGAFGIVLQETAVKVFSEVLELMGMTVETTYQLIVGVYNITALAKNIYLFYTWSDLHHQEILSLQFDYQAIPTLHKGDEVKFIDLRDGVMRFAGVIHSSDPRTWYAKSYLVGRGKG
jgi:hypothetical protein